MCSARVGLTALIFFIFALGRNALIDIAFIDIKRDSARRANLILRYIAVKRLIFIAIERISRVV